MDDSEFLKKRKFRYILPEMRGLVNGWFGPGVSKFSWTYFLKGCDWFEVVDQFCPLLKCKEEGVIPCLEGAATNVVEEAERIEWPLSLLPNSAFGNSARRWEAAFFFRSSFVYSFLFLNDEDLNAAWQYTTPAFRGAISRVRHFLRPSIYRDPFYAGPQKWDVLLYLKSMDFHWNNVLKLFPNFTYIQNGYYTYEELRYKARRSRFCLLGSAWDTYGIAMHEIAAQGCPVLVCNPGTLPGNFDEGRQGLYLRNATHRHLMGSDLEELDAASKEVLSWDRKDVRRASLDFADPDLLRDQWKSALYGEIPEHRTKPTPFPWVWCFQAFDYVARKDAEWVQSDREHGYG